MERNEPKAVSTEDELLAFAERMQDYTKRVRGEEMVAINTLQNSSEASAVGDTRTQWESPRELMASDVYGHNEIEDVWSGHKRAAFTIDLARELYLEHCKQRQGKAPQNYAPEVVRSAKELADALELED